MKKYKVGIVGATGMVGQRFSVLLDDHPFFEVTAIAASPRSAGKTYTEALGGRWKLDLPMPEYIKDMVVLDANDTDAIKPLVDFVFCAIDLPKAEVRELEEKYAKSEIIVVSNNSACRGLPDVPMLIPEINPDHTAVIETQKKRLGTKRGFIAVKPNCSIQSYVPLITPLLEYEPYEMVVTTYQAISGAGKTFAQWPEMVDNVIPYIGGEEEKSEKEPLKIWGRVEDGVIKNASLPVITTQCIRVPVTNGHLAAVFVKFKKKPTKEQILKAWDEYEGEPQRLKLPSAPEKFITYFEEDNRPQTKLDRDIYGGMGITAGRLREDTVYDYKFIGVSHNTLRGAAGGAVLSAEYLAVKGFLD
ncbi:MAG: aspartate-semialdehyde dehydrogenase [Clostridia bacterium]|nr:aspartate-semialdehyde dehydrogenase [Clostridia bacterium]